MDRPTPVWLPKSYFIYTHMDIDILVYNRVLLNNFISFSLHKKCKFI